MTSAAGLRGAFWTGEHNGDRVRRRSSGFHRRGFIFGALATVATRVNLESNRGILLRNRDSNAAMQRGTYPCRSCSARFSKSRTSASTRRNCDLSTGIPLTPCAVRNGILIVRGHRPSIRDLAEQRREVYVDFIELRPNDLASPRPARRTDDLLPKLETRVSRPPSGRGSTYTHT